MAVVLGADAYDFAHDELRDEEEVELVADFLQALEDYGEAGNDLQSGERVRARFALTKELAGLSQAGFIVYGELVRGTLEGGVTPPSSWNTATVRVKRVADMVADVAHEATDSDGTVSDSGATT